MRPALLPRSVRTAVVLFFAFAAVAATVDGAPRRRLVARLGSTEAQWLRARAVVVESTDPETPLSDLAPLALLIGDATVVTLGEGTHFTSEFQTMHHRLIRMLAESLGFRTFAFEASWPDFRAIDDYLRSGEGDPVALLEDDVWLFWDTAEMADLLRWARAWNASHPEADWISFAGVDAFQSERLVAHVIEYLERVDPAARATTSAAYTCLKNPTAYRLENDSYRTACRSSLQSVADSLAAKRSLYESLAGARAFAGAARSAAMLLQAERIARAEAAKLAEARDEVMAENVRTLAAESPGGKIVFRGHNLHASTNGYLDGGIRLTSAGAYLRRDLGAQVFAIGSTSSRGTYHALNYDKGGVGRLPAPVTEQRKLGGALRERRLPRHDRSLPRIGARLDAHAAPLLHPDHGPAEVRRDGIFTVGRSSPAVRRGDLRS